VKAQCTRRAYLDEYSNTVQPVTVLHVPNNVHLPPTSDRQIDYLRIQQKDPLSEFFLHKEPEYRLKGYRVHILRKDFQVFNLEFSRPSNFLFQTARGLGATLNKCPFSSKKHTSLKDFFRKDHFKVSLRKNLD
jgi:hypothetical protein